MRFYTLGSIEIRDGAEEGAGARLEVAPKNRALLAYLALAHPRNGFHARDVLAGLFWAEHDQEHARSNLRKAVYELRRQLGPDVVVTRGKEEVRLARDHFWCDAVALDESLEAGDVAGALELYRGQLLPGMHLSDSPEFERWLEEERGRIEKQVLRSIRERASAAEDEDNLVEAARWHRRALEVDPYDEETLRQLMAARARVGDRTGAIQAYEAFVRRLSADLDLEPTDETVQLAEQLRTLEPDSPLASAAALLGKWTHRVPLPPMGEERTSALAWLRAHPRPSIADVVVDSGTAYKRQKRNFVRPAVALGTLAVIIAIAAWLYDPGTRNAPLTIDEDHPARITVLPFETRGEGTDLWREGMVDLVSTNVDLFSGVRAVPSRTSLAQWREAGLDETADMERMLDVARRTGARYAVTGSVLGTTDGLRIRSEMFDLESGTKIADAVAFGSSDSIYSLVDRVSVELLSSIPDLNRGRGDSSRLARLTGESPIAMQAFLEGERLFRGGQYQPALEAYLRAVEADSTLALAYYRLTDIAGWMGGIDGGQYASLAMRYADRLPDREHRLVRAVGHLYEGDGKSGVELLRQAVRLYPNDAEAWYWLGEAYLHAPMYKLIPRWEFVDVLERSVALDPGFFAAYAHLIHEAFLGTPDSARAAKLLERQSRVGETRPHELVAFDLVFGDTDHKRTAMEKLDELTPLQLQFISDWAVAHPRFLDLKEIILRKALEQASPTFEFQHRVRLFWTLLGLGKVEDALREAGVPYLAVTRATLLYEARQRGYPIPEETLRRSLKETPPVPENFLDAPTDFERGAFAAEVGDWNSHQSAKQQLRALIPRVDSDDPRGVVRIEGLIAGLDGYAAWQRDDRERALELLRDGWKKSTGGGDFNKGTGPRNRIIRWWLAELLVELGRPQDALAFYESTITLIQQDPMAFYRVAELRDELGDREGALEAYENVAAAWSGDIHPALEPLAAKARSEAARLRGLQRE